MNSYIAIALVLCIAVAQVQSQGAPGQGGIMKPAATSPTMGNTGAVPTRSNPLMGGMAPFLMMSGNDMMRDMMRWNMMMRGMGPMMGGNAMQRWMYLNALTGNDMGFGMF
ncbi:uncharacterized protein LOC117343445 isoform X3 [Pecten maximus]|uniref:uncharacterized protein LOC117343445 isoform X1 n=1 Tax=Pecten maximus TaxID=6579 RepID=UPI001458F750|nr:uncharacterized protein LOC117343445 isoform X1 [Pecten maximus]XP_033761685.1 uncharacterized protein LOC117343445 isoform X2 [Pecten maximus]XP_033761686.1 uncharacterized protein LOC117343445 isoform X3 [Pecten maximus]